MRAHSALALAGAGAGLAISGFWLAMAAHGLHALRPHAGAIWARAWDAGAAAPADLQLQAALSGALVAAHGGGGIAACAAAVAAARRRRAGALGACAAGMAAVVVSAHLGVWAIAGAGGGPVQAEPAVGRLVAVDAGWQARALAAALAALFAAPPALLGAAAAAARRARLARGGGA